MKPGRSRSKSQGVRNDARKEKAATNLRDRLPVKLLFRLGCRASEALSLTVEHIDLQQRTVTIQHLKARLKLTCPRCGEKVKAVAQSKEHRRLGYPGRESLK